MQSTFRCPKCGGYHCQPVVETTTYGKDYSAGKGCCGWLIFGPIGLLCGLCGEGRTIESKTFWMCPDCGNKFRA